jgi:hypothetical protein
MKTKLESEFVSYEISYLLNDKGFDCECLGFYDSNGNLKPKQDKNIKTGIKKQDLHESNILAPLYQQVIRWFLKKHGVIISLRDNDSMDFQIERALRFIRKPF